MLKIFTNNNNNNNYNLEHLQKGLEKMAREARHFVAEAFVEDAVLLLPLLVSMFNRVLQLFHRQEYCF